MSGVVAFEVVVAGKVVLVAISILKVFYQRLNQTLSFDNVPAKHAFNPSN